MISLITSLDISSILSNGISDLFQLFGEFLYYLITLPTSSWAYVSYIFSENISQYGTMILPMMVVVFGITFLVFYTVISTSRSIDSGLDIENMLEGAG